MLTTTDAGGPLEVVADGSTGLVTAPDAAELARAAGRLREHPDEARGLRPGGPRARRARDLGQLHRATAGVRVAYYSPMPPERSGIADYSAHLLPALSERIDVEVVRRGRKRPVRGTDLALYHVGNNPDAHGWIVDALRRRPSGQPSVVVLHDFVLHHLVAGLTIGRRDGHGYLDAMEREGGVVGRLLGHGVLDKRIPPLWESRPEEFHLAGEVLDLATGLIVHSRYVEERARASRVRGAGLADPASGLAGAARSRPRQVEGSPLIGCFREREREQAHPAAARGLRALAPRPAGGAAPARRRGLAGLRPRPAAAAARPVRRGHRPGGVRARRTGSGR